MLVEIYALTDPETQVARYIGQSRSAKKRHASHIHAAKRNESGRVYNWIRSLLREGVAPGFEVLEVCLEAAADEREIFWIAKKRQEGLQLTNCTDGGGGIRGWVQPESARLKIGNAHRGKVLSPDGLRRLQTVNIGRKLSQIVLVSAPSKLGRRPLPQNLVIKTH